MSLLNNYLEYTKNHESCEIYHKWCMIAMVGAILSGRCWTHLGYFKLNPNFFLVLAGPPALPRKTDALDLITEMVSPLRNEYVFFSSESGSAANLIDEFEASQLSCKIPGQVEPHTYMNLITVNDEITNFLPKEDRILHSFLLGLYKGKVEHKHGTRYRGTTSLFNVSYSLLTATTHDFFKGKDYNAYVSSGFTSRCIILYLDRKKGNFRTAKPDQELKKEIQKDLLKMMQITGAIEFSEVAEDTFFDWYKEFPTKLEDFKGTTATLAYYGRKQTHVRKVALVLWAMDYIGEKQVIKEICPKHVKEAIEIIEDAEQYLTAGLKTGGSAPDAEQLNAVITYFQSHIGTWVSRRQLIRFFMRDINALTMEEILGRLVEIGGLKVESVGGSPTYLFKGIEGD